MHLGATTPEVRPVGPLGGPRKVPLVGMPLRLVQFFTAPDALRA